MASHGSAPSAGAASPVDVLVVGAGLAGVALATQLRGRGLEVLLVERAMRPTSALRGEYFQPLGVRLAQELGLGWLFQATGAGSIHEFHFRDVDTRGRVRAELLMRLEPGIASRTVPHPALVAALWEHARAALGPAFRPGTSAVPEPGAAPDAWHPPVFRLEGPDVEALRVRPRWVVACDGRHSAVRAWLEGPRRRARSHTVTGVPLELLVGADIPHAPGEPSRYTLVRSPGRGTLVTFWLGGERQRLYWNVPAPRGRAAGPGLKHQWDEALRRMLGGLEAVHDVQGVSPVCGAAPAETAWLGPPARGRFLFAGDAAAVTTALGGQGLTCALQHVASLLENVDWKEERCEVVEGMGRRHAAAVRYAYQRVDVINRCIWYLFFSRSEALRPLAAKVLTLWNEDRTLSDIVLRRFAGLDLRITRLGDLVTLLGLRRPFQRLRSSTAWD